MKRKKTKIVFLVAASLIVCFVTATVINKNFKVKADEVNNEEIKEDVEDKGNPREYQTTLRDLEFNENIQSFIGCGYNVVLGDFFNREDSNSNPVVNSNVFYSGAEPGEESILDTPVIVKREQIPMGKNIRIEGENEYDYLKEGHKEYNVRNLPWINDWYGFLGALPMETTTSQQHERRYYKSETTKIKVASVKWNIKPEDYYKYLNPNFIDDVLNPEVSAKTLFQNYGTHILTSVEVGGKCTIKYRIASSNSDAITNYKKRYDGYIDSILGGANPTVTNLQDINQNVDIFFQAKYFGGIDTKPIEDDYQAMSNAFDNWVESISQRSELIDIVNEDSLLPIWELIDWIVKEGNVDSNAANNRKEQLKKEFFQYGLKNFDEKCKYTESEYVIEQHEKGTKKNTKYNIQKQVSSDVQALHNGFHIGELTINNVTKEENGSETYYTYNSNKGFQLRYKLEKMPESLGNKDLFPNLNSHKVVEDKKNNGKIADLGKMFDKEVGYGGCFVQVQYNDSSKVYSIPDLFKKLRYVGDMLTIYDSDVKNPDKKEIKSIKVGILYKTEANIGGPFNDKEVDWRIIEEIKLKKIN